MPPRAGSEEGHRVRLELSGQARQRDVILGHHQQPGCALVQPVHDAWPQHMALEAPRQLPLFAQPTAIVLSVALFGVGVILCYAAHTARVTVDPTDTWCACGRALVG